MNLSQLEERVRIDLAERDENGYFKSADIIGWLNEGLKDVARKVKYLKGYQYIDSLTVDEFALPDDFIKEYMVKYAGDKIYKNGMDETYMYDTWGNELTLNFTPDGGKFELYYYRIPSAMVNDIDTPEELPETYHDLLITYALYKGKLKDKQISEAQFIYQKYLVDIKDAIKNIGPKPRTHSWKVIR